MGRALRKCMEGSPTPSRDRKKRARVPESVDKFQERQQQQQEHSSQGDYGRRSSKKSRSWGKGDADRSDFEVCAVLQVLYSVTFLRRHLGSVWITLCHRSTPGIRAGLGVPRLQQIFAIPTGVKRQGRADRNSILKGSQWNARNF